MTDQDKNISGDTMVYRPEYEQFTRMYEIRHSELRLEIKEMETSLKADIQSINKKIDGLSIEVSTKTVDIWKIVATNLISFIMGVGVYYILYATHIIH